MPTTQAQKLACAKYNAKNSAQRKIKAKEYYQIHKEHLKKNRMIRYYKSKETPTKIQPTLSSV
jgi:hypothetical protein